MTRRTERIQEAIRRVAGGLIHDELKDPRIGFITVTRVEVTPDLRCAKIFYSVFGDAKARKDTRIGLENAKKFLRARISDALKLKFAPLILLKEDKIYEESQHIEDLFSKLKKEKEDGHRGSSEGDKGTQ